MVEAPIRLSTADRAAIHREIARRGRMQPLSRSHQSLGKLHHDGVKLKIARRRLSRVGALQRAAQPKLDIHTCADSTFTPARCVVTLRRGCSADACAPHARCCVAQRRARRSYAVDYDGRHLHMVADVALCLPSELAPAEAN